MVNLKGLMMWKICFKLVCCMANFVLVANWRKLLCSPAAENSAVLLYFFREATRSNVCAVNSNAAESLCGVWEMRCEDSSVALCLWWCIYLTSCQELAGLKMMKSLACFLANSNIQRTCGHSGRQTHTHTFTHACTHSHTHTHVHIEEPWSESFDKAFTKLTGENPGNTLRASQLVTVCHRFP